MLLLSLLACGDVSNAIFDEDADFLAALPSAEKTTLAFDEDSLSAAAKTVGEPSELLYLSRDLATNANTFVGNVLDLVDEVRALPPTVRADDERVWGPYDWRDDAQVQATITRVGSGRFDWQFDCMRGDETQAIAWGTHYAGDTVAEGDGQFTWDVDAWSWCTGDDATGLVAIDYDNREGTDIVMDITGWTGGGGDPVDGAYAYTRLDGVGDFQYTVGYDVNQNGSAKEQIDIRTRWVAGEGGRSDAVVSDGDMGAAEERWSQCWSVGGLVEYETDTLGLYPTDGDADACVYDDFAEIDRFG